VDSRAQNSGYRAPGQTRYRSGCGDACVSLTATSLRGLLARITAANSLAASAVSR
jgi:hypothetical protein